MRQPRQNGRGWGVRAIENKETYGWVLESINANEQNPNKIVMMSSTFYNYDKMKSLKEGFKIPVGVIDCYGTFEYCSGLESLPDGFIIPNTVYDMSGMFYNCTKLVATITINAEPRTYTECFKGVKSVQLTGTSTMLNTLKNTGDEGTVSVVVK